MSAYRLYTTEECGKDGYPEAWHTIKHEVREAAGYRCVRCGHPYRNGTHGKGEWTACDELCTHGGPIRQVIVGPGFDFNLAQWRILTVHHLDGNKLNLRWWNLAALCQRCHLEIQGRVHVHQIFPWPHSEWFRPYAAGFYAWTYLQEDLTREETLERMDELLALECVGGA